MPAYSDKIQKLIKELSRFPGVGPRSAERMVFYLLKTDAAWTRAVAEALIDVKESVFFCEVCNNLSEETICHVCRDDARDHATLCIVEEPKDVIAIEKSGGYNGVYHVLLGALSPLNGIGPKELKIAELARRMQSEHISEVIIATNVNTDGETTALYLQKLLRPFDLRISRIACGVPRGASLEYIDQETLACALQGRKEYV
jgi:recombination protein RecR